MSVLTTAFARENFNLATNSMKKPHFLRFWLHKFLCERAEMMNPLPKNTGLLPAHPRILYNISGSSETPVKSLCVKRSASPYLLPAPLKAGVQGTHLCEWPSSETDRHPY